MNTHFTDFQIINENQSLVSYVVTTYVRSSQMNWHSNYLARDPPLSRLYCPPRIAKLDPCLGRPTCVQNGQTLFLTMRHSVPPCQRFGCYPWQKNGCCSPTTHMAFGLMAVEELDPGNIYSRSRSSCVFCY